MMNERDLTRPTSEKSFSKRSLTSATSSCYSGMSSDVYSIDHENSRRKNRSDHVQRKLAASEQQAVFWGKISVITVMIITAIILSVLSYLLVQSQEYNDFNNQFGNYASEIIAVSQANVQSTFGTVEAFSVSLTSFAKATGQQWPYVTFSNYESLASRVKTLANARMVILAIYVTDQERLKFEQYTRKNVRWQVEESIEYSGVNITYDELGTNLSTEQLQSAMAYSGFKFAGIRRPPDSISRLNLTANKLTTHPGPGPYLVNWQKAPWSPTFTMTDMYGQKTIADAYLTSNVTKTATLNFGFLVDTVVSQIIQPIFDDTALNGQSQGGKVVGLLRVGIVWGKYFTNLLSEDVNGIIVVLKDKCGPQVTYEINGLQATYVGQGDFHDTKYDHLQISENNFFSFDYDKTVELPEGRCVPELSLHIYPTDKLRESFTTYTAQRNAIIVVSILIFASIVFAIYDYAVRRRQTIVMKRVLNQDRIVSNMFPEAFRDRLYEVECGHNSFSSFDIGLTPMDSPMAELYVNTTIMFADIVGFTAWSSAREPQQVFILLETIYSEFDTIAMRRGVFKVETVGDCYVAAAGVPDPTSDHAVVMARFARECLGRITGLTHQLEMTLGPDTGDLNLRIGLHSGQVTAGVLRGERSRFQLFGDTMNTAARMESTSAPGKIQVSSTTANILRKEGYERWLKPRAENIFVKGKGEMQTNWLKLKRSERRDNRKKLGQEMAIINEELCDDEKDCSHCTDDVSISIGQLDEVDLALSENGFLTKTERLIEWNVDVMMKLLQQVVAARVDKTRSTIDALSACEKHLGKGSTVLEQHKEIITLPKVGLKDILERESADSIDVGDAVAAQLRDYIAIVSGLYRDNPFHNFEHACHVMASVRKLLSRIVSFDGTTDGNHNSTNLSKKDYENLTSHSFGITSDPLTQFAVVFSALIHDMDHPGVTNAQLVKEGTELASLYKERSVAEQNSVDMAWKILMRDKYRGLRACIYSNEDELRRFRQLVVNVVMATDICDKELQTLRKARWAKAFDETPADSTPDEDRNRKATIVIEHLIQASDVSHTMQHWQIFRAWNKKLFMEMYRAFKSGRMETDPSEGWYKGEIGFYDFYIIPLAKKLENCGVFGVSSYEYLNYAEANREEWARTGEAIVQEYLKEYEEKYSGKQ